MPEARRPSGRAALGAARDDAAARLAGAAGRARRRRARGGQAARRGRRAGGRALACQARATTSQGVTEYVADTQIADVLASVDALILACPLTRANPAPDRRSRAGADAAGRGGRERRQGRGDRRERADRRARGGTPRRGVPGRVRDRAAAGRLAAVGDGQRDHLAALGVDGGRREPFADGSVHRQHRALARRANRCATSSTRTRATDPALDTCGTTKKGGTIR